MTSVSEAVSGLREIAEDRATHWSSRRLFAESAIDLIEAQAAEIARKDAALSWIEGQANAAMADIGAGEFDAAVSAVSDIAINAALANTPAQQEGE